MQQNIEKNEMHKGWILTALMATISLAAMDNTIVAPVIPHIVGDLGGFSLFSWLFSIYLLVQTIIIPIYGKLADIYGRKPILLFGTVVFLLGSVCCAVAWDMHSLIWFRGLQAVGAGAILATVNTIAGDIYTIKERAKIQGWLSSVWGVSAILGPAIGGTFADTLSWRWIFLINLPIGGVAMYLLSKFYIERRMHREHRIDWLGAMAMMITGTIIMFMLLQGGQDWSWLSYNSIVLFIAALIMISVTIYIERRVAEPILPFWIWKNRVILGVNIASVGFGALTMAPSIYIPLFAQSLFGISAVSAGFILASMSISWTVTSSFAGNLYLKIGFRNTAIFGVFFVILGTIVFYSMGYPGTIWALVGVQLLLGGGFGLMSASMIVGVQSVVAWRQRGVVTGATMFSRYLGQTLGTAIFTLIFNSIILDRMIHAPENLQGQMPKLNDLTEYLKNDRVSSELIIYLHHAFFESTHAVYISVGVIALLTLFALFLTPASFPIVQEDE